MNILEISSLNKSYGDYTALTDIHLQVPKGIVFGLLGPNGAGKTTLIRIVNQIIAADTGEIKVNEESLSPKHIRNIGYLPEERGLYKAMKVGDQLMYFARLKGLSKARAKERVAFWLDKLEIKAWKEKRIEDLSKGMAQKIQFITTVIHEPDLLILDEPFSGFDPVNAEIIKNEILQLKDKGTSVILSTHRMESVELLCDRIAMIHKSHKVLDGTVQDIKKAARKDIFKVRLKKNDKAIPQNWELIHEEGDELSFFTAPNGKGVNALLGELMGFGEILGFEELVPSIEEIFIQKIKESDHV